MWHPFRFLQGMARHSQPNSEQTHGATSMDMRNGMDFFCMLKACAVIKRLLPGQSAHILTNDRNFLADLRRVHPECLFETVSCVMGFEESADFLVRVSKPESRSQNKP